MSRNRAQLRNADMAWAEEAEAQLAANARKRGDAYLKYWAAWAKTDPDRPRLARNSVIYVGRYDQPEKLKLRPEARGDWLDDLADAVGCMVLALPAPERATVYAVYLRIEIRQSGNALWAEHIREWHDKDVAKWLGITQGAMWMRLARARARVESLAEQMGLIDPPELDA